MEVSFLESKVKKKKVKYCFTFAVCESIVVCTNIVVCDNIAVCANFAVCKILDCAKGNEGGERKHFEDTLTEFVHVQIFLEHGGSGIRRCKDGD
jgi:hypothetical protein